MNNLRSIDLKDPRIKARSSSTRTRRKLLIGFLSVLIVSVMIAWVGFLGWGLMEILRAMATWIGNLSTKVF